MELNTSITNKKEKIIDEILQLIQDDPQYEGPKFNFKRLKEGKVPYANIDPDLFALFPIDVK